MTERESYQCIQISEGCQEGPDFSAMSSDRIRDHGHKLEHRKLHLNMKKNFTLGVTDHWNTPEWLQPPSLEILKTHLDTSCATSSRCICLTGEVELDNL